LQWYDLAPATSYDILVVSSSGTPTPPSGSGNYAVAANVPQSSVCANGVCSYTDTQAARSSYTLPAYWLGASTFWAPKLNLWPGGVILSPTANSDFNIASHPVLYTDLLSASVPYISSAGGVFPQVFALHCQGLPGNTGYVWPICLGSYYPQNQMRLMAGAPVGGNAALQNLKGVLNVGATVLRRDRRTLLRCSTSSPISRRPTEVAGRPIRFMTRSSESTLAIPTRPSG